MSPVSMMIRGPVVGPATELDRDLRDDLARLAGLEHDDPEYTTVRNTVVCKALPLADRLARRFAHRGESMDDLSQVARLGLVKSVDHFDNSRGTGFTRFATPSILGELKRHFRDKGWLIRVPRRLQETRLAMNRVALTLTQRLGREPTPADFARELDIPVAQVRDGIDCGAAYDGVSLQSPLHRDSGDELGDTVGDRDPAMDVVEDRVRLGPALRSLPQRERRILAMRFADDMTQSQIAERVELSQMHVSRLLRSSLAKLRAALRGR